MRAIKVLLACAAAAQATAIPRDVTVAHDFAPETLDKRIIGGQVAGENLVPFIVSLSKDGKGQQCGGSLVSEWQVVTAAHCVYKDVKAPQVLEIRAGSLRSGSGGQAVRVQKVNVHKNFLSKLPWVRTNADIAVLDLAEPIRGVPVATLPDPKAKPQAYAAVVAAGWGVMRSGSKKDSPVLRYVDEEVVHMEPCKAAYKFHDKIRSDEFCTANPKGGMGSCQGDSGGPVIQGKTFLGVISRGNGCGSGYYPDVNISVSQYVGWIRQVEKARAKNAGKKQTPAATSISPSQQTSAASPQ